MKRIIYTTQEGNTSIIIPTEGTEDFEALADKVVPKGLDYEIVDISEIPQDRTYRDAWVHDKTLSANKIGVTVKAARAISLALVRGKRDQALQDLDKQFAIAERSGIDTAGLAQARLELLAATDKLKAIDVSSQVLVSVTEAADLLIPLEP